MTRAEMRREKKKAEKVEKAMSAIKFIQPAPVPAPVRMHGLSASDVSKITGINLQILNNWCAEKERDIREEVTREVIKEAQQKLDTAEDYIALHNILYSLKSLEGFRYAKSAAKYMVANYVNVSRLANQEEVRETYEYLNKIWGVEFEFDNPDLNKLLGFDTVDWRKDYIKQKVPVTIVDKISEDAANIENAVNQLAAAWTLCEDFGFHKYGDSKGNKFKKFMQRLREKYDIIDNDPDGIRKTADLINRKYGIEITFTESMKKTLEVFGI